MRPGTYPWASTSPCLPLLSLRATPLCSLEPPRRAGSEARTSAGAAPSLPAGGEGLRGIHFPSSLGAMGAQVSVSCSGSGSAPRGASKSASRKAKEELSNLAGGAETGGKGSGVPALCRQLLLPGDEGGRAAPPWQSSPTSEQLLLFPSLAVGLPRYQHHPSPVCDRKDFVLNFNGISSFHPSASGSYYHHHHHQSVCQDIKPCVM